MASDEWRVTRSRRRTSRRLRGCAASLQETHDDDFSLQELRSCHRRLRESVQDTNSLLELLRAVSSLPSGPLDVCCLGLGSPANCGCARLQLALLDILITACPRLSAHSTSLFDPAFTSTDRAFLRTLFGEEAVAEINLEGCVTCRRPTLVFMPHCPLPLLNNVLFANWTTDGLGNLYLLGNRLVEALEAAAASGSDITILTFVRAAAELTTEAIIPWDGHLTTTMACTSLQWFPNIPPSDSSLWKLKGMTPPDYSDADVGELICAER